MELKNTDLCWPIISSLRTFNCSAFVAWFQSFSWQVEKAESHLKQTAHKLILEAFVFRMHGNQASAWIQDGSAMWLKNLIAVCKYPHTEMLPWTKDPYFSSCCINTRKTWIQMHFQMQTFAGWHWATLKPTFPTNLFWGIMGSGALCILPYTLDQNVEYKSVCFVQMEAKNILIFEM